jgi:hypothetical protein
METASYWEIRLYRLRFCRRRFECSFLSKSGRERMNGAPRDKLRQEQAEVCATKIRRAHRKKTAPNRIRAASRRIGGARVRLTPKSVTQEDE